MLREVVKSPSLKVFGNRLDKHVRSDVGTADPLSWGKLIDKCFPEEPSFCPVFGDSST